MHRTLKLIAAFMLVVAFTATYCVAAIPVFAEGTASLPIRQSAIKQKPSAHDSKGGANDDEVVTIMVKLTGLPLLAVTDLEDERVEMLRSSMNQKRKTVIGNISEIAGQPIDVLFNYSLLFNGFSFKGPAELIDKITGLDGVADCYRSMSWELPDEKEPDERVGTSVDVINATALWNAGYNGSGMAIAVIDTGIKQNHSNFSVAPTNPRYTADMIDDKLSAYDLNCEELYSGNLTGNALYYSAKIPYRFNYVTGTTDASHSSASNDHGTHVSSIAAGSDSTVKGVAFNAQIVTMQVFEGRSASWSTILAALEDCAYLGVDCINMSLGSDCGFTTGDADVELVLELLQNEGVNLACAAGNSGYGGSGNAYGFGQNLAMDPDNGLVSSPSSYFSSVSVAACNNNVNGQPAYFSSWGSTSDLRIKPELMAPGVSIYAATDPAYSYGSYGTKSGTSMASPEIAGCITLLTQYVAANYSELSHKERIEFVNTLLLSTARPRVNNSNVPYSPRVQGAGLVDMQAAMSTPVYISVENCSRPKLEIGDDPERTGVFTLEFELNNISAVAETYSVSANVQTEAATARYINGVATYSMSSTPRDLTTNSVITGGGTVTVPANGSVTVTITVDMSAYGTELDGIFPNGIYIEGFITIDGNIDLSIPYLGFYGDWDEASVIDRTFYWDIIRGETTWKSHDVPNVAGSSLANGGYLELGANPFIETNDFLADRISISPNGDGVYDSVDVLYTGLLRNCSELVYTVTGSNGAELMSETHEFMPKGTDTDYGYIPAGYYDGYGVFSGWNGAALQEGATANFRIDAKLDSPDFNPENNECASWGFPVTIDSTAPQFVYWRIEDGVLTLYATDSHYLAYIGIYSNSACTVLIDEAAVCETSRGALSFNSFDIGNASTVYVKLGDYAGNVATQALSGEGGSLEPVALNGVSLDAASVAVYESGIATVNLLRNPINANNFDTEWVVAEPSIASVRGGLLSATITGVNPGSTSVTVTATDRDTGLSFTASADITVLNFPTVSEAVSVMGHTVQFTSSGTGTWSVDMESTPGRVAVKSGNAGADSTSCTLQSETLQLLAGDVVAFDWCINSEYNYDFLSFVVNNNTVERLSGSFGWTRYTYVVPGDGNYTFAFTYSKDNMVSAGSDCGWVDEFSVTSSSQLPGDVDNNGEITGYDALLTLRRSMLLEELTAEQMAAADVNGNGVVDTGDALLIARYHLGLIGSF